MSDWMEELEKLNGLREKGILSDGEFLEEKQRVLASRTRGTQEHPESSTHPTSENISQSVGESLSSARIQLLAFSIFCFGIVSFVASFFDFFYEERLVDTDDGVMTMVLTLFFSLITLGLIYFSDDKEKISKRVVGFVLPFSIAIAFSELWLTLCILFITPLRNGLEDMGGYYSEVLGPGFWITLGSRTILIFIPIWICLGFLRKKYDSGSKLIRKSSLVLPAMILGGIAQLYPTLKPNQEYSWYGSDFTPFKYTFEGEVWEIVVYIVSLGLMPIVAGFIVMKISDRTTRSWGVFSILYLLLFGLANIIAANAETGKWNIWSFGATLWTIGLVIVALLIFEKVSRYLLRFQENANTDFQ